MEFNKKSRKRNAVLLSGIGLLNQLISNIAAFIYRTVFIYWMSVEYLGINGLFSNIIQVFSLAELGIGSVIIFRLYKPIKENDVGKTAALMYFYKRFYQFMAVLIIVIGGVFVPFLPNIIRDTSEIPSDINIYVVYILYLIQSATSYTFAYRQALLDADQKGYVNTAVQMIITCMRYGISIAIIFFTRNYTLVLGVGIAINLFGNIWIYWYVNQKYADVFHNKSRLKKEEIIQIYKDTGAMLCHRIGSTVVTSTDNIVMSMYVGTVAVGKYSNYYMIIQIVQNIMNNLLGNFTASIGNHALTVDDEEKYMLFRRLRFANMWLSVFCTGSLYLLINPFIEIVWGGGKLLFTENVVLVLCISFFLSSSRIVNGSFSNAMGLFVYDRTRPLIEAFLNLAISIFLARQLGVVGVFLGTILSSVVTVWWREPYLLYKKVFHQNLKGYFFSYIFWIFILAIIVKVLNQFFNIIPLNPLFLIIRFAICGIGINVFLVILFRKNPYFLYYVELIKKILRRKKVIEDK